MESWFQLKVLAEYLASLKVKAAKEVKREIRLQNPRTNAKQVK